MQAVQTVFEFRGVPEPTAFLATPAEAKLVREFMRSGATLGETFYGPVSFDEYGQNKGREPTTLQASPSGIAEIVFPSEHQTAAIDLPSPASSDCAAYFFKKPETQNCSLCAAECSQCPDNSLSDCMCPQNTFRDDELWSCKSCPKGMTCGKPGLTKETVEIENGYWRNAIAGELFLCKDHHALKGTCASENRAGVADDLCAKNFQGVM